MISIRNTAALFLLTLTLCSGVAIAQPPTVGTITAKDSFTLTQVFKPTQPVDVFLEDDPDPKAEWKVVAGSAEKAAKLPWLVDARCAMRLKSLTVKQADGKIHDYKPAENAKNLKKEVSLTTFSPQHIRQLCLDIANNTFVTANGDAEKIHDLELLQKQFDLNPTQSAVTEVSGALLLSGQCTSPDGDSIVTNVVDKKFPASIQIRCAGQ